MTNINIISENDNSTVISEYKGLNDRYKSYQSEDALEQEFIKTLQGQSYEYLKINSEEELISNLRKQLEKLNNYNFSDNEWNYLFNNILTNSNNGILEKTRIIQEDYIQTIDLDNGDKKNIYLIDKNNVHNNYLQVINQYESTGNRDNRYDVTVLVNGFPMIHIELKRRGIDIREAFNQINRYQRDSFWAGSGLYEYIQIFVISNGTYTKYYSNTTRDLHLKTSSKKAANTFEFTSYWADQHNNAIIDLIDFTNTFFAKHTILNIISKYCIFTSDDTLLVMRPYQIVAAEKIINKIEIAHNYKFFGSIKAGGYVWHTTGSGKTLTSFKASQIASKLDFINKVIFVVDRKDLDYQTMKEYDKFKKGAANSNISTKVLEEQLRDADSKIIITTIQKLDNFIKKNPNHEVFEKQVVFIFDECHRSQFGDMHKNIIKKFNKYYIFGFTGTPIFAENCKTTKGIMQTTEQVFGDKLHTYTIVNAINDKNVLPFRYEYIKTIKMEDNVNDEKVNAIDTEKVLASPERINLITNYIIDHFSTKTKTNESYVHNALNNVIEVAKNNKTKEDKSKRNINGFNSIFAVSSIEMAKKYYESFKNNPTHNLKVALIYSFGANDELVDGLEDENSESTENLNKSDRDFLDIAIKDYNEIYGTSYDTSSDKFQNYYKDVSLRMKNKEIDILIVANMFLTGFDATTLNTLWVDKNLKYHGLIQAFSRTNRILNSVKTYGNIVCFRNLEKDLNEALALFGDSNASSIVLLKTYDEYYNGYEDKGNTFVGYKNLVEELKEKYPTGELIMGETNQKEFIKLYGIVLKTINILSSFDRFETDTLLNKREVQDYHSMYIDLYNHYRNVDKGDKVDITDDIVFEMELVKQIEVNIDYILTLIQKYHESNMKDKEILITVNKAIMASPDLRNKKDLIEEFINSINGSTDIYLDFASFMNSKKKEELDKIIVEENLNKDETYNFIRKAFENGSVETNGTEVSTILPPMSRFSMNDDRFNKKKKVLDRLMDFFDKFFSISSDKL
ncbi:MAG: type I restriction endonuclease subunit R [Bacilli bacterium]|nr:type I restriction endonuclease subunit R [Bacilli bacterium]